MLFRSQRVQRRGAVPGRDLRLQLLGGQLARHDMVFQDRCQRRLGFWLAQRVERARGHTAERFVAGREDGERARAGQFGGQPRRRDELGQRAAIRGRGENVVPLIENYTDEDPDSLQPQLYLDPVPEKRFGQLRD